MEAARSNPEDNKMLARLALALVDHPRATLQQLAKCLGIGRTTLHRFCSTREALIARLVEHSADVLLEATLEARLLEDSPREALRRLIANHLEHRELTAFLLYHWKAVDMGDVECRWEQLLDEFFLHGQKLGAFRIDIPAQTLTEAWTGVLIGLVEGEHRGRVARFGMVNLLEDFFLNGAGLAKSAEQG